MSAPAEKGTAPGYTPEFGQRLQIAIDKIGGTMAATRVLGKTKDTIGKWRDGVSKISLHDLSELAGAAGVDPIWLAFGEQSRLDEQVVVPIDAIRETWDFWMPVILRLKDRPDPTTLREQFLADVMERARER